MPFAHPVAYSHLTADADYRSQLSVLGPGGWLMPGSDTLATDIEN